MSQVIFSAAKNILKALLYGCLAIVGYMIVAPVILWTLGYYPDGIGWEVAATIVERNGQAGDCRKIIHTVPHLFSPSGGEQRANCLYKLASLTLDPSACELLLPGEYGLACISNLWPEVLPDDGCGWSVSTPTIYECRHRGGPLRQSANCSDFIDNEKQFSACIYDSAERAKDLGKCAEVPDDIIRSFCETRINTWLRYPDLRSSFYFGTPVPID